MRESDFYTARTYARITSLTPERALPASLALISSPGLRSVSERDVLLRSLSQGMLRASEAGWTAPLAQVAELQRAATQMADPVLRACYIRLLTVWGYGGAALAAQEIEQLQREMESGHLNPGRAQQLVELLLPVGIPLSPDVLHGLSRLLGRTDSPELGRYVRELLTREGSTR